MKFLFSLPLAVCWLLPAFVFAQDDGSWNEHFQSACIRQAQPAFHSQYAAPRSLRGDAGAVRVPAFRSRARMATYDDALAAPPAGTAPSLDAVRTSDRTKVGLGIDAEPKVAGDMGLFVRALQADGRAETDAFTEPGASPTAGASPKGTRWPRGKDVVGVALGADAIWSAHRACLERGGLTAFLGDGTLRDGRERLAEVYYSTDLGAGLALTADAQRVANPGYDQDRGPASFYALRLHREVREPMNESATPARAARTCPLCVANARRKRPCASHLRLARTRPGDPLGRAGLIHGF